MPITLLDTKSAARAIEVKIQNKMDRTLKFEHKKSTDGVFTVPPPDVIAPHTTGCFTVTNDNVEGKGVDYTVVYAINGISDGHGLTLVGSNRWELGHASGGEVLSAEAIDKGIKVGGETNQGNLALRNTAISEHT